MRILPSLMKRKSVDLTNAEFTLLKRQEWSRLISRAYASMVDGVSNQPLHDKVATLFAADTRHADSLVELLNNNPILRRKATLAGFDDVAISEWQSQHAQKLIIEAQQKVIPVTNEMVDSLQAKIAERGDYRPNSKRAPS
ncbi:MAG: hypothetical protein AB7H77_00505 [Bdellovibrionales bacterium]